jgi:hypothetical protein
MPEENRGTQYRKVTAHPSTWCMASLNCGGLDAGRSSVPEIHLVGRYDTDKLHDFSTLSDVPLVAYQPPQVTGAAASTRAALHDKPLKPDRNLGGYLSPPPTILTTLDSVSAFAENRRKPDLQDTAPVGAIRIRVAGVTGADPVSRARVNAVVGQIRAAYPKLQVDITVGSSPAPQTIVLSPTAKVTVLPPVAATGRAKPVRSVTGLAMRNLLRVRDRTLIGAAGLALLGGLSGALIGLATVLPLGQGVPARTAAVRHRRRPAGHPGGHLLVCAALAVPIRGMSRIAPAHLPAAD